MSLEHKPIVGQRARMIRSFGGRQTKIVGVAYDGGMMYLFGWSYPVVVDLKGLTISEKTPLLFSDRNHTLGRLGLVEAKAENGQIKTNGYLIARTDLADKVIKGAKIGQEWDLVISAEVDAAELVMKDQTRLINGVFHDGPFYHVTKSTLRDVTMHPAEGCWTHIVNNRTPEAQNTPELQPPTPEAEYTCTTIDLFDQQVMLVVGDFEKCCKLIEDNRAPEYKGPKISDGLRKEKEMQDRNMADKGGYHAFTSHVPPSIVIYSPEPIAEHILVHEISHAVDFILSTIGSIDWELRAWLCGYIFRDLKANAKWGIQK